MKNCPILTVCLLAALCGCDGNGTAPQQKPPGAQFVDTQSEPPPIASDTTSSGHEKSEKTDALETALVLESGVFGIPFGATTDEIIQWCTDNGMLIVNPTEEDVKKDARRAVQRIEDMNKAYDFEMGFLTPLEQELLELAQGYRNAGDVFELAKVAAAKEKLDVLKNPTVSYEDQKYHLEAVHKGMEVRVDDERRVCTDERICGTAYRLSVTPTEKSEKLIASGLTRMDVLLHGDIGQQLRAYATLAILGGNAQRSANTQFGLVLTALREKYGMPKFVPRWRSSNGHERSYEIIAGDMYELVGIDCGIGFFSENAGVIWARNLILLGDLHRTSKSPGAALRGSDFWLLYYDHKAATRIFELHEEATKDFQDNYHEEKKEALAQIQRDF